MDTRTKLNVHKTFIWRSERHLNHSCTFNLQWGGRMGCVFNRKGTCNSSMVGKSLCYHASDPGSNPRGGQTNRSPYPLVLSGHLTILPRSVNEYRIILAVTPGHRQWELLPSTTTSVMSDGLVPTIRFGRSHPCQLSWRNLGPGVHS